LTVAEGKTNTYVLSCAESEYNSNSVFDSNADTLTVSMSTELMGEDGYEIRLGELKLGDIIYVIETNVPDRWVGGITDTDVVLYKMETAKVPIENYSLKSDTIKDVKYESNKLQKIVNGGSSYSDIMNLSLDSSTGAITIGSVTKTPLYSHQTMYYREIKVGGTQKISGAASTALDFKNDHSVQHTYDGGLHSFVMSQTAPSGSDLVTGEIAFLVSN